MSEIVRPLIDYPSYEDVAAIDPLEVDKIMALLPALNRDGDIDAIRDATGFAVANVEMLGALSQTQALAALRDIDFLASSLLRHGEQPLDTVEKLEETLVHLGEIAGTVPRGTVFTYAAANPKGERRRSFTGTAEEEVFIEAVTTSIVALDRAVDNMGETSLSNGERLNDVLIQSGAAMDEMITSILEVKRVVTPEFFTFQMRPYFEPLEIKGQSLTGAGGAQMQLVAVDRMLWGCQDRSDEYEAFFEENYLYLTPAQQAALEKYLKVNGNKSIVGWLSENADDMPEATTAAIDLLRKIRKFRYPHRKIARDNFKLRPSGAVGSGTYTPDILDILIDKTETSIAMLEEARNA